MREPEVIDVEITNGADRLVSIHANGNITIHPCYTEEQLREAAKVFENNLISQSFINAIVSLVVEVARLRDENTESTQYIVREYIRKII